MQGLLSILASVHSPREPQRAVAQFMERATARALAVQADTGTGKTAVLLAAAVAEVRQGRKVILSTHTIPLLRQSEREAARFGAQPVRFAVRLGMRNFVSHARVETAWGRRLAGDGLSPEDKAGFESLREFSLEGSGLIEDYSALHGDLPAGLQPSDICLLPSARAADKAAWQRARQAAGDAQVTIQTHALTLLQARFGSLPPVVIFDEADALGETADAAEDRRLSLSGLRDTMGIAGINPAPLDLLLAKPGDTRRREALAQVLDVPHGEEEVRFALAGAQWILRAHRLDSPRRGTEVIREGGDTVIRSLWADRARWIWENLRNAGVERAVFASATLAVGQEVEASLRSFGVHPSEVQGGSFSPRRFGEMTFRVIPEAAPQPLNDGAVNPEWRSATVAWLSGEGLLRAGSRPLVLARSYEDAGFFATGLGLIAQQQGQSLAACLERFRSGEIRGLVTPAGWAGVDLPGLITDLVILRLPYAAADELKSELMGLTNFGAIKADMQRKLRQGIGRGIRTEKDSVLVWLADPRVHDPRAGVRAAIPARFQDAFLVACGRVRMREIAVRTAQEKFREELISHYGGRCVISGCAILEVLEAAHRPGRSWKAGHNRAEDGILLRSDLHKLLDGGLLSIEGGIVRVDASVARDYGQYDGKRLPVPTRR
jgi:Rad3-related DNA helicase